MRTEFDFINYIKKTHGLKRVGDDCVVLPKDTETDLLITADLLMEDIDFRLSWTIPEMLGKKALAVSVSDIAAMGGVPKFSTVSLGVPKDLWEQGFVEAFYEGWLESAKDYGVELVGGDISRSPDKVAIDSVVIGEVGRGKAILRSTARAGQKIAVTGSLGGAAGGLQLLEKGSRLDHGLATDVRNLINRQLVPTPRSELGLRLQRDTIASAMIDVSDGLLSDLSHVCDSSGVGARIYGDKVPVDRSLILAGFDESTAFDLALNGGEDLELLFTCDEKTISALDSTFTVIGEVTSSVGVIELNVNGKWQKIEPKGYRHF